MVGLAGFEPAASSSRTKRATKLRYNPMKANHQYRGALTLDSVPLFYNLGKEGAVRYLKIAVCVCDTRVVVFWLCVVYCFYSLPDTA